MALSNGRGWLNATDKLYKVINAGYTAAFNSVIASAVADMQSYWTGWTPSTTMPLLLKVADGPESTIQPKHPAITISPSSAGREYPMCTYSYDINYTYACPKDVGAIDTTLLSCQLAQEAMLKIFKDTTLLSGIGWSMDNWYISELREASLPAPIYSRSLSFTVTLQIEEDY